MKLSTKGRYALVSMVDIATHAKTEPVRVFELSERQNISMNYLEQLFRKLRKAGLVRSVRGPGGGYFLARDPADIRIHDVFMAVEESVDALKKGAGAKGALSGSQAQSLSNRLFESLSAHVYVFLHQTTLADVIEARLDPCPALPNFLVTEDA